MNKVLQILLALALSVSLVAQTVVVPLGNARLTTPLDVNAQALNKAQDIRFGATNDTTLARTGAGALTLTGNLAITGTTSLTGNLTVGTTRPITLGAQSGALNFRAEAGGWNIGTLFSGSAGTVRGFFGAGGENDTLTQLYLGSGNFDTTWQTWNSTGSTLAGNLTVSGTSLSLGSNAGNNAVLTLNSTSGTTQGVIFQRAGVEAGRISFPASAVMTFDVPNAAFTGNASVTGNLTVSASGANAVANIFGTGGSNIAQLDLKSGNGTDTSRLSRVLFRTDEATPQRWDVGLNGSKDFTIVNNTLGSTALTFGHTANIATFTSHVFSGGDVTIPQGSLFQTPNFGLYQTGGVFFIRDLVNAQMALRVDPGATPQVTVINGLSVGGNVTVSGTGTSTFGGGVTATGTSSAANFAAGATGYFGWGGRTLAFSDADGSVRFTANNGSTPILTATTSLTTLPGNLTVGGNGPHKFGNGTSYIQLTKSSGFAGTTDDFIGYLDANGSTMTFGSAKVSQYTGPQVVLDASSSVGGITLSGGSATVTGNLTVNGAGTHSFSGDVALTKTGNATHTLSITNGDSGSAANAGLSLVSDAGTSGLRQYSAGHNTWPNYVVMQASDNIALNTGTTSNNIELMTGGTTRVNVTTATTSINNNLTVNGVYASNADNAWPGALTTTAIRAYASSVNGAVLYGKGSSYDVFIANATGQQIFTIPTGTNDAVLGANSSSTVTVAGSLNAVGPVKSTGYTLATGTLSSFNAASGGLYSYYSSGGVIGAYSDNAGTFGSLTLDGLGIYLRPNGGAGGVAVTPTGTTVTNVFAVSSAGNANAVLTSSSATNASYLSIGNTGASGTSFDVGVGGAAHALTGIRNKLYAYNGSTILETLDASGNKAITGNLTVNGTGTFGSLPASYTDAATAYAGYSGSAAYFGVTAVGANNRSVVIRPLAAGSPVDALTLNEGGNATIAGILLVNGTGQSTFNGAIATTHATSEQNNASLNNTHATGYGLYSRGGDGSRYIANFVDKDANAVFLLRETGSELATNFLVSQDLPAAASNLRVNNASLTAGSTAELQLSTQAGTWVMANNRTGGDLTFGYGGTKLTLGTGGALAVTGNISSTAGTLSLGASNSVVRGYAADNSTLTLETGVSAGVKSTIYLRDSWNGSNNANGEITLKVGNGSTQTDILKATTSGVTVAGNLTAGTARPVVVNASDTGTTTHQASAGGWNIGTVFKGSAGTNVGFFGANGTSDSLTQLYLGGGEYASTWQLWTSTGTTVAGNLTVNGTGEHLFQGPVLAFATLNSDTDEFGYGLRVLNTAQSSGLYFGAGATAGTAYINSIDPGTTWASTLYINSRGGNTVVGNGSNTLTVNGTLRLEDSGGTGTGFHATLSHHTDSPYRIAKLTSRGGTGTWRGAFDVDLNYNGGSVFRALRLEANTDGTTATATLNGNLTVSGIGTHQFYGPLQLVGNGQNIYANTPGTGQKFLWFQNTGGDAYFGIESSTAGGFFTGSQAYETVIYSGQPVFVSTPTLRTNGNLTVSGTGNHQIGGAGANVSVGSTPNNGISIDTNSDPDVLTYEQANTWIGIRAAPQKAVGTAGIGYGIVAQPRITSGTQTYAVSGSFESPSGSATNWTGVRIGGREAVTGNFAILDTSGHNTRLSGKLQINSAYEDYQFEMAGNQQAFLGARIRNDYSAADGGYVGYAMNAYGNSWGLRMGNAAANGNALEFISDLTAPTVRLTLSTGGLLTASGNIRQTATSSYNQFLAHTYFTDKELFIQRTGTQDWGLRAAAGTGNLEIVDWTSTQTRLSLTPSGSLTVTGNVELTGGSSTSIINNGVKWIVGSGSPEGNVAAAVGSFYSRTDGTAGLTFYVKESGTGTTGWVAK